MKITIPTCLADITWGDYMKYQKVMAANDITENIKRLALVTIFCKLTLEETQKIPLKDLGETAAQIERVLDFRPVFQQRFKIEGKEFGFIPNLDLMTAGEYIDLDTYFSDNDNFAHALAVLYRPIKKSMGGNYKIEAYKGSHLYHDVMMNVNLDVALGCKVFFYLLSSDLLKVMEEYLKRPEVVSVMHQAGDSLKNGDGIKASTRLLKEIDFNLSKRKI